MSVFDNNIHNHYFLYHAGNLKLITLRQSGKKAAKLYKYKMCLVYKFVRKLSVYFRELLLALSCQDVITPS